MKALKHMEAIFIAALLAIGAVSFVAHAEPAAAPAAAIAQNEAAQPRMAVVVVTAKRLTPAEKQRLLLAERAAGSRA